MEKLVENYHQLLSALETCQKSGNFTLGEATAVFSHVINLKNSIESLKGSDAGGAAAGTSKELNDVKLELMTTKITCDNLQRELEEANESIDETHKVLKAVRAKYNINDDAMAKVTKEVDSGSMTEID